MKQHPRQEQFYCWKCNGSGEGMANGTICPVCRGRGEIYEKPEDEEIESSYDDLLWDERFRW